MDRDKWAHNHWFLIGLTQNIGMSLAAASEDNTSNQNGKPSTPLHLTLSTSTIITTRQNLHLAISTFGWSCLCVDLMEVGNLNGSWMGYNGNILLTTDEGEETQRQRLFHFRNQSLTTKRPTYCKPSTWIPTEPNSKNITLFLEQTQNLIRNSPLHVTRPISSQSKGTPWKN